MKQVSPSSSSQASVGKGWGAFFSPPIFVGTHLEREARSRHNGGRRTFVKALDTVYKGRQVIVSREGLVVLAEAERATALALLNEVMAVILLRSVPVYGIREMDLVECSIDMANKGVDICKLSYGARSQALQAKRVWPVRATRFYHPDNIRSFIQRAEVMTSNSTVRMDLRLLLDAFTRYQEWAFTSSFLLSWQGIERLLQARWRRLTKQGQGDDGEESATSDSVWNTGRVIEELHSCNAIDSLAYQEAKKLYEKQRNIIKLDQEATIGESEPSFHFFLSQLRKTLASE